jgi:hypothetical protein
MSGHLTPWFGRNNRLCRLSYHFLNHRPKGAVCRAGSPAASTTRHMLAFLQRSLPVPALPPTRRRKAAGGSEVCSPRPQGVWQFAAMVIDDEVMMYMLLKEEAGTTADKQQ